MFGSFIERYENKKKLKIKVPEGTKIIKDEAFCYYEYDKSASLLISSTVLGNLNVLLLLPGAY